MTHPNTTPAEREAMLAQFDADVARDADAPADEKGRAVRAAMRDLIIDGTIAYLGNEMLELTQAGQKLAFQADDQV